MDLVFFSVAKTTPFEAFKPTEAAPEDTACNAYSICINFPEGLFRFRRRMKRIKNFKKTPKKYRKITEINLDKLENKIPECGKGEGISFACHFECSYYTKPNFFLFSF